MSLSPSGEANLRLSMVAAIQPQRAKMAGMRALACRTAKSKDKLLIGLTHTPRDEVRKNPLAGLHWLMR
jgi:hypothetical protein